MISTISKHDDSNDVVWSEEVPFDRGRVSTKLYLGVQSPQSSP